MNDVSASTAGVAEMLTSLVLDIVVIRTEWRVIQGTHAGFLFHHQCQNALQENGSHFALSHILRSVRV